MHACRQASRLQAAAAAGRRWRSPTWAREAKPPLLTPPVPEALASELWMRAAASEVMGVPCLEPDMAGCLVVWAAAAGGW